MKIKPLITACGLLCSAGLSTYSGQTTAADNAVQQMQNCRQAAADCGILKPDGQPRNPYQGFRRILKKDSPLNRMHKRAKGRQPTQEVEVHDPAYEQESTLNLPQARSLASQAANEAQPGNTQAKRRHILSRGAPIHGTNGLAFDAQGKLTIASVLGREIVSINPRSGRILNRQGPDQGVDLPDDVAYRNEGSLYWTSPVLGLINRQTPQGDISNQFLAPNSNSLTFADDGRLFVSECLGGSKLFEVDPDLVEEPRLVTEALGVACGLNGMDWQNGFLYGPRWFQGNVVRVDPFSGDSVVVADGFGNPAAVKFDDQGRLFVLDTLRGEIVIVDVETGDKQLHAVVEQGLDNLAFDARGRLFVSSLSDGYIARIKPNGRVKIISRGGMIVPGGIAVLPGQGRRADSVYVADFFSLREFSARNGRKRSVERNTLGGTVLTAPMTASADGNKLVLSSWFANSVQVWNPQTREVEENYGDFAVPMNAVRFGDNLVVAELLSGSLVRADANDPSQRETLMSGLLVPTGIAASNDDLWVADWATGLIWQVVMDSSVLSEPLQVAGPFEQPEGLALDHNGNLLVVETGRQRLVRVDPQTGSSRVIASQLALGAPASEGVPPTWMFNGVDVGSNGNIYVSGDQSNVLYRFKRKGR